MMDDKVLIPNLPVPESTATRLPLLVDICLQVSQIFILLVAMVTAIASIIARVDTVTVILRTAIAILAVGIPVYVLNFLIGRYYVKATLEKMEQTLLANRQREIKKREDEELQSEMDKEA